MNQGMKETIDESVQELRLGFSACIPGRIKIGFLAEHIFFQGSGSPVLAERFDEEGDISTIVTEK